MSRNHPPALTPRLIYAALVAVWLAALVVGIQAASGTTLATGALVVSAAAWVLALTSTFRPSRDPDAASARLSLGEGVGLIAAGAMGWWILDEWIAPLLGGGWIVAFFPVVWAGMILAGVILLLRGAWATWRERNFTDPAAPLRLRVSRALGAMVCGVRGHHYYYPLGEVRSWCAYSCVRCGALDRDLDSLPNAPDPDDADYSNDYFDEERDDRIEEDHRKQRRWVSWLPWPRWQ